MDPARSPRVLLSKPFPPPPLLSRFIFCNLLLASVSPLTVDQTSGYLRIGSAGRYVETRVPHVCMRVTQSNNDRFPFVHIDTYTDSNY